MAILTVANLSADFGGLSEDTTSTTERDSAYSPTGIQVGVNQPMSIGWPSAAVSDDTWAHFRMHTDSGHTNSTADGHILTILNAAGQTLARLDMQDGNVYAVAYGDSTINGNSVSLGSSVTTTLDLRLSLSGGNITFDVYTGGGATPVTTAVAANTGGKLGPTKIIFDLNDVSQSSTADWYFSEFIATDGEDTRGWRLATLEPNTNGNYNQWNGDVNELGDTDSATTIQSDTGGERQSWNPTAYGGPSSPSSIRAVVAKAQAARGLSGSPSQLSQFLRIASVDYDGTAEVFATGEQRAIIEVWDNNPNTTNPWDTSDLATLEVGLLSTT